MLLSLLNEWGNHKLRWLSNFCQDTHPETRTPDFQSPREGIIKINKQQKNLWSPNFPQATYILKANPPNISDTFSSSLPCTRHGEVQDCNKNQVDGLVSWHLPKILVGGTGQSTHPRVPIVYRMVKGISPTIVLLPRSLLCPANLRLFVKPLRPPQRKRPAPTLALSPNCLISFHSTDICVWPTENSAAIANIYVAGSVMNTLHL